MANVEIDVESRVDNIMKLANSAQRSESYKLRFGPRSIMLLSWRVWCQHGELLELTHCSVGFTAQYGVTAGPHCLLSSSLLLISKSELQQQQKSELQLSWMEQSPLITLIHSLWGHIHRQRPNGAAWHRSGNQRCHEGCSRTQCSLLSTVQNMTLLVWSLGRHISVCTAHHSVVYKWSRHAIPNK